MSLWRHLTLGLRALGDREATDRDISDEVGHYMDQAVSDLVESGLSVEEARRTEGRELGRPTAVREEVHRYGWENAVETLLQDLRYAARRLRSDPGIVAVSVLTLALGIGATTAVFSVADPILFAPLPYPRPDRLVAVFDRAPDGSPVDVTFGTFRELSERSRSFHTMAVSRAWRPTLAGTATPERLAGQRVTAGFFGVMGVSMAIGRAFDASEDRLAGPKVVILTDGLWRGRFGADSAIVGAEITLDGDPFMVIGVTPRGFENVVAPSAQVWSLLQYDASLPSFDTREWGHHLDMVARVQAGASLERAGRELHDIALSPISGFPRPPWAALDNGFLMMPLKDHVMRAARPVLLAVLSAVTLLLVIACVNVTNLLLAQGARRRGEFALRTALGAGRFRLIRQLLTESLLLATLGGIAGALLAAWGVQSLLALSPADLPRLNAMRVDGAVLAVAFGITTLVGVVVGLTPALRATRVDPQHDLWETARGARGTHRLVRRALVVAEVSLTLMLLVGAGLLVRSLDRLFASDPGFDPTHRLVMQVQTSGHRFDEDEAIQRFFANALEAVRSVPGVSMAAMTSQLPLSGEADLYGVQAEGGDALRPDEDRSAFRYAVTPGYLESLGIPLRQGRALETGDRKGSPPAVLISESLARHRFGQQDPLGRRVHVGRTDLPWYTVVGVVGDVKQTSLSSSETEAVYLTPEQSYFADSAMWLVIRTRAEAGALVPAIKAAVWSVDGDQPIVRIGQMEDLVAASAARRTFALRVFQAFALAALLLAAIGLYGVLSSSVTARMRELGVRSALGASRGHLLGLVVREGIALTGLGIMIGAAGAMVLSRALQTLLFGISPLDPPTYLGVIALLAAIAGLSSAVPAWRAVRVDAWRTLRVD